MADIKTRKVVKGTIKAIDKSAVAAERMRSHTIRVKGQVEGDSKTGSPSPSPAAYASDQVQRAAKATAVGTGFAGKKVGKKAVKNVGQTWRQAGNAWREAGNTIRQSKPAQSSSTRTQPAQGQKIKTRASLSGNTAPGAEIPGALQPASGKNAQAIKTTKRTAKAKRQTVKTAQQTGKAAIKTADQTAKATAKAAQTAVRASQRAAQAAATAAKTAAKATAATIKAAVATANALITALAAGGWVVVVIVLLVGVIGMILSSCFGIFFGGDSDAPLTLQSVIEQINTEYQSRIDFIKTDNPHDVLESEGTRATWSDVLSVYAIKTATDPENPQEVATMDDSKKELLEDIFWQMNTITYRTEDRTEVIEIEEDDGAGGTIILQQEEERTYLYITVNHKTALEMAETYSFSPDQLQQLEELLAEANQSLWNELLYGIQGNGNDDIVAVALSQVGQHGGQPYWSWMGFGSRVDWCACFVSWCANDCGYIDRGQCPRFSYCDDGVAWFQAHGQWKNSTYTPNPGDIIFFDSNGNGHSSHVGIVEKFENGVIYTIEGNCNDAVVQWHYGYGSRIIMGYGVLYQPEP